MRAIRRGIKEGRIVEMPGMAQVVILAWAMEILPPAAVEFEEVHLDWDERRAARAAVNVLLDDDLIRKVDEAIEEACR